MEDRNTFRGGEEKSGWEMKDTKRKKGNNYVSVSILFFNDSLCRNFILLYETSKLCC